MNPAGGIFRKHLVDAIEKRGEANSFRGRDVYGLWIVAQAVPLFRRQQVNLVFDVEGRLVRCVEFLQHLFDLRILFGGKRAARVGNMQDERRTLNLFKCRAEGRYKRGWKIADKTNRI